jgi:alkylated DNA repair protein alkB homolog 1
MPPEVLQAGLNHPSSKAYKKALRKHLKTTRNRDPSSAQDWTPFRVAEKRYKARFPPPDLSDVLDLNLLDEENDILGWQGNSHAVNTTLFDAGEGRRGYIVPAIPGTAYYLSTMKAY